MRVIALLCLLCLATGTPINHQRQNDKTQGEISINTNIDNDQSQHASSNTGYEVPPRNKVTTAEIKRAQSSGPSAPKQVDLNLIDIPTRCPNGQGVDQSGQCRPGFGRKRRDAIIDSKDLSSAPQASQPAPACIIGCDLPSINPCPPGQKPDPTGTCRVDWDS